MCLGGIHQQQLLTKDIVFFSLIGLEISSGNAFNVFVPKTVTSNLFQFLKMYTLYDWDQEMLPSFHPKNGHKIQLHCSCTVILK